MRRLIQLTAVLIITMVIGCSTAADSSHAVRYTVGGTASSFDITYENEDGGTSQKSDVSSGWSYSFEAEEGDFVYISAQNTTDNGSVEVTIYNNGEVFKTSESEGEYVIATADGTL